MEVGYKVSLIANNLHLTQCIREAGFKDPLITNNLHLTQ